MRSTKNIETGERVAGVTVDGELIVSKFTTTSNRPWLGPPPFGVPLERVDKAVRIPTIQRPVTIEASMCDEPFTVTFEDVVPHWLFLSGAIESWEYVDSNQGGHDDGPTVIDLPPA